MSTLELPPDNPFSRGQWHGRVISVDDTPADDVAEDSMAELLASGTTPNDWDGECAGAARLTDGRFCAWESDWGPTGSGFSEDAYGGGADIFVGASLDAVMWMGLSATGRRLCGWPETKEQA